MSGDEALEANTLLNKILKTTPLFNNTLPAGKIYHQPQAISG